LWIGVAIAGTLKNEGGDMTKPDQNEEVMPATIEEADGEMFCTPYGAKQVCPICDKQCEPSSYEVTIPPIGGPCYPYKPDYAVPPGRLIWEYMEDRAWTPSELASKLCWPSRRLADVVINHAELSLADYTNLALTFGTTTKFWQNVEVNYRATLARLARKEAEA